MHTLLKRPHPGVVVALEIGVAVAMLLCMVGMPPWRDNPVAFLVVGGATFVSLGMLGVWILVIWQREKQSWTELAAAREQLDQILPNVPIIVERIRESRETPNPNPFDAPTSVVDAAMHHIEQSYVAGESFNSANLQNQLSELAAQRLVPLQKAHDTAMVFGFVGTGVGLLLQIIVAQNLGGIGILDSTFLSGIVLKASSTVAGLLAASYAASVRWRRQEGWEWINACIVRFTCLTIAPALRSSEAASARTGGVPAFPMDELDKKLEALGAALAGTLNKVVTNAEDAFGNLIRTTLVQTLRAEIVSPFMSGLKKLETSVGQMDQQVLRSAKASTDAAQELGKQLRLGLQFPKELGSELARTQATIGAILDGFRQVLASVGDIEKHTKTLLDEFEASIEKAQLSAPGPDGVAEGFLRDVMRVFNDWQRQQGGARQ